jgi:hypothetical protein
MASVLTNFHRNLMGKRDYPIPLEVDQRMKMLSPVAISSGYDSTRVVPDGVPEWAQVQFRYNDAGKVGASNRRATVDVSKASFNGVRPWVTEAMIEMWPATQQAWPNRYPLLAVPAVHAPPAPAPATLHRKIPFFWT